MAQKQKKHIPEAGFSKDSCPERDKEEAELSPPDALLLLLLPQDILLDALDEQLLAAVTCFTAPPVTSAHSGMARGAVAGVADCSSESTDSNGAQMPGRLWACASATDWSCCSAGAVCLCHGASVIAQSQSVEAVREDSSAAVCDCSSLVSSRCHCTGNSGKATIASLFVTAVNGCWVSGAELLFVHWTEEMEAILCLSSGESEACESHEETLCLSSGARTVGQNESEEAVRAAAAAVEDEAGKGKLWGADCIGGRLSES